MPGDDKYRLCAAAVIFNKEGLYLVGERMQGPGQWQFPQGGVDPGETPEDAAKREMYEEIGLSVPKDVTQICTIDEGVTYDVPEGTWLSRNGYKGQRMYFSLFFYPGEGVPPVDLKGLGGEKPEFRKVRDPILVAWHHLYSEIIPPDTGLVKWMGMAELLDTVWEQKLAAYVHLRDKASPVVGEHLAHVAASLRST